MTRTIDYCIIGGDSGIASHFIKLLKNKNKSFLITSRKNHFKLDMSSVSQLNDFDEFLRVNKITFENVIYFVGVHNKSDKDKNLFVNFYSLVYTFSIIKKYMNKNSVFTYLSSEAHRFYRLPLGYIKGYALSKIYSMAFLYNIKRKVHFKIKIYSPPFTDTKIINDKNHFFNKIEHFLKTPIDPEIVSKRLYKFLKNDHTNFYFTNDKPSKMYKDVYKKKIYKECLNKISTFSHSESGNQYIQFFNNLYDELYGDTISTLQKNKLYYQYNSQLVKSDDIVKKIINTVAHYKSSNDKVIININMIKKYDYNLYLELIYIYKQLSHDLSEKFNLKLKCIETTSVESIDIYYYPYNIFIKNHVDYYQNPNEFKFNTVISSNKDTPMYVEYNNIKVYPKTNTGLLARTNILTHGVDPYNNTNRYLLQFVFSSDMTAKNDRFYTKMMRKHSKKLRKIENKFNISNNRVIITNKYILILILILIFFVIVIIYVKKDSHFKCKKF